MASKEGILPRGATGPAAKTDGDSPLGSELEPKHNLLERVDSKFDVSEASASRISKSRADDLFDSQVIPSMVADQDGLLEVDDRRIHLDVFGWQLPLEIVQNLSLSRNAMPSRESLYGNTVCDRILEQTLFNKGARGDNVRFPPIQTTIPPPASIFDDIVLVPDIRLIQFQNSKTPGVNQMNYPTYPQLAIDPAANALIHTCPPQNSPELPIAFQPPPRIYPLGEDAVYVWTDGRCTPMRHLNGTRVADYSVVGCSRVCKNVPDPPLDDLLSLKLICGDIYFDGKYRQGRYISLPELQPGYKFVYGTAFQKQLEINRSHGWRGRENKANRESDEAARISKMLT